MSNQKCSGLSIRIRPDRRPVRAGSRASAPREPPGGRPRVAGGRGFTAASGLTLLGADGGAAGLAADVTEPGGTRRALGMGELRAAVVARGFSGFERPPMTVDGLACGAATAGSGSGEAGVGEP